MTRIVSDVVCKSCDAWLISRTWRYRVTGHNPYSILSQFEAWFAWEVKRWPLAQTTYRRV